MYRSTKSGLPKGLIAFITFAFLIGFFGPTQLSRQLDELRIEEAHDALLSGLVDSRNFAWDEGVTVGLCAATSEAKCTELSDGGVAGWLSYTISASGSHRPLKFYPFQADYIALITNRWNVFQKPFGFDEQGYSLQTEVVSINLYSLSGLSKKTYTLVIEPSGALQTLANLPKDSTRKVAQASADLKIKEG